MASVLDRLTPLPSQRAALNLVEGRPGAVVEVTATWLFRAGLIASGLYMAGQRKQVWKSALTASGVIEVFVVGFTAATLKSKR